MSKGFKNTEIGVIPADWNVVELQSVSDVVRGGSPRPAGDPRYFGSDHMPWLTVAALTTIPESSIYVSQTFGYLTEEGVKHSRTLEKGTLILSNSGATLGVAKILNLKCCANDGIAVILNIDENVDNIYLCYYLNSKTKKLREVVATGIGQPNLNTSLIGAIKIPLPPTKIEQTAIATALSDADALISSLEKLVTKKRNIKQGAMQQLLTSKERLRGFNGEWGVKKLGAIFKFLNTANNSRSDLSENGDVGYIHYGDIHTKWTYFLDCSKNNMSFIDNEKVKEIPYLNEGDLVIADASEDYEGIGACVEIKNIGDRKIVAGLHTLLLRGDRSIIADGFKGYLRELKDVKESLIRIATGISVYGISKNNLKNIDIKIPLSIEEQTAIAQIISDMDAEIEAFEKKLTKYRLIKQGMMQKLLIGKTRLV